MQCTSLPLPHKINIICVGICERGGGSWGGGGRHWAGHGRGAGVPGRPVAQGQSTGGGWRPAGAAAAGYVICIFYTNK
jgi:hypothetical protein